MKKQAKGKDNNKAIITLRDLIVLYSDGSISQIEAEAISCGCARFIDGNKTTLAERSLDDLAKSIVKSERKRKKKNAKARAAKSVK